MKKDTDNGSSRRPRSGARLRIHPPRRDPDKSARKILVVDDNKVILKTTATKLNSLGYEVVTAEDCAAAMRQVRETAPQLILLDLNFPPDVGHGGGIPWDGLLLLGWLRRTTGGQNIPVMVITGGDLAQYKERCLEAGVQDIFLKPLDHEALAAAIRSALEQHPAPEESPLGLASEAAAVSKPEAGRKILLVDHANDWRSRAAAYLSERDYEVVTVEDPIHALLEASNLKPDVVVLDLQVSGEGGAALFKVLAKVQPEVPVLVCSGIKLDNAQVADLRKQGASDCLRKGSPEELFLAVEKAISGPEVPVFAAAVDSAKSGTRSRTAKPNSLELSMLEIEAAPELGGAFVAPDNQLQETADDLSSLVETDGSVAFEDIQSAPEPGGRVPVEAADVAAESILIIEDDAPFADTLRSFLEPHSFRVVWVDKAAEAVQQVTTGEVDVILFDLTLPDLPVQQFYRAVEAAKPHLCPRIIYMTSDQSHPADDGFVRRLKGISLWKPFPMEWLVEALQSVRAGASADRLAAK